MPGLVIFDVGDSGLGNSKQTTNCALVCDFMLAHPPNQSDLMFVKLCTRMSLPGHRPMEANSHSVFAIVAWADVFQVFQAIITLQSILMINLLSLRARTQEG